MSQKITITIPIELDLQGDRFVVSSQLFENGRKETKKSSNDDEWMTVKEVAKYLKLSEPQIYRYSSEGLMPCSKLPILKEGRQSRSSLRFHRKAIREWLLSKGKEENSR